MTDNVTGTENKVITGNVLLNDTDPNGLALSVAPVTLTTAHGAVVENATGTITYTPAAGCFAKVTGNWSVGANWNGCTGTGGIPAAADNVTISTGITITIDASANTPTTTFNSITINGTLNTSGSNFALKSKTITIASGGTLTANGSVITLSATTGTLLTNSGTFTAGTSEVDVTGAGTTTLLSAATTLNKLVINNSSNFCLRAAKFT